MTTPTPAPTAALAPKPERKPRTPSEKPVHKVLIWNAEKTSTQTRLVYGTEAQAFRHVASDILEISRATPQDLVDAGKADLEIETAEGGDA